MARDVKVGGNERWRHVMPFSHCPISRSAFGHHRLRRRHPFRPRDCHHFFGGFRARLREFKLGRSAPDWLGRAAGNGVNGSLILSRSKQLKRRMLNGRFLITRGELSSSFSSVSFKSTIKTKTLKCIEKVRPPTARACVSLAQLIGSSV